MNIISELVEKINSINSEMKCMFDEIKKINTENLILKAGLKKQEKANEKLLLRVIELEISDLDLNNSVIEHFSKEEPGYVFDYENKDEYRESENTEESDDVFDYENKDEYKESENTEEPDDVFDYDYLLN